METIKKKLNSTKRGLKEFHTKKPQIEFFTALLTVPVLLTVIILNVNNLRNDQDKKEEVKEPEKSQTIVITQPSNSSQNEPNEKEVIVTKEACKAGIGNVEISNPDENEEISENPVEVDINYDANGYCTVVWSYRVNSGGWSSYDDSTISLYNLSNGNTKLELRVKSVVDSSQKTLTRNFTYSGASVTSTPTPTVSPTPAL